MCGGFQPNHATSSFVLQTLTDDNQTPHEPIEFSANEIAKIIKDQLYPNENPSFVIALTSREIVHIAQYGSSIIIFGVIRSQPTRDVPFGVGSQC